MLRVKEYEVAARIGYLACMGKDAPAPSGEVLSWLNATAELLDAAYRADARLTTHYVSLYLNEGPLREPRLAGLSGAYYDAPLEAVREDIVRRLPASIGTNVIRALLLTFRQETLVRPYLLCLAGLLKIARRSSDLPPTGPDAVQTLDLAYLTFFENASKRGKPKWTGRTFGAASSLYLNEVNAARKTTALSLDTLDALEALGESVGQGGDEKADGSHRLPLHRLRNNVYHGDATFEPAGRIELGLSAAWVERLANGKVPQVQVMPADEFRNAEASSEGLFGLVAGFRAAARKIL